jgi:DNA-binding MarR family transcriptional regulator
VGEARINRVKAIGTGAIEPVARGRMREKPESGAKRSFNLEEYVPYLLNRVGMQIAFDVSRDIRHFRIKYSHLRVMLALFHHGPLRISDVAMLTIFELSTLSRVVVDLEKKGFISRLKNHGKSRIRQISLTPKGEDLVKRLLPIAQAHEATSTQGLSAGERALLIELLNRMRQNLETARQKQS